jgi:hypothetical protein
MEKQRELQERLELQNDDLEVPGRHHDRRRIAGGTSPRRDSVHRAGGESFGHCTSHLRRTD